MLAGLAVAIGLATYDEAGLRSSGIPMSTRTTGSSSASTSVSGAPGGPGRPAEGAAPTTSMKPASSDPSASTTPPGKGRPGPASSLATAGDCAFYPDAPRPAVLLSWKVGAPTGDAQRVELSSVPRGLDTGSFLTSPPLSGQQPEFLWEAMITAGQSYSWRVVATSGSQSSTSPVHTFVADPCLRGGAGETP